MTTEELLEIIKNGESSRVEFKSEDLRPDSLASEIVSFANFAGGTILIGVSDAGEIQGVIRADMEEFVINVCRNNIKPSIIPLIEKRRIKDKLVYMVIIAEGDDIYSTSKGIYFIRVGSTKQQPTQQELLRLFQKRNLIQFDEIPVLSSNLNSIDNIKVNTYLKKLDQSPLNDDADYSIEQDLINLSILTSTDTGIYPTIAGLLLFGKHPQKYFPSYIISCGAYAGTDFISDVIREDDITGTIEDIIEKSIAFLKLTMQKFTSVENGVKRVETYIYPTEVLREAIVNAVCHRDYTISGAAIRILLFQDRLEIRSPGSLPNTLTLESMIYRQFTRNQTIASFLAPMGYMEKSGKGILKMLKLCELNSVKCELSVTDDKGEFVVKLMKINGVPK